MLSSGVLALLARASSLTAMALSSLPVWQRVDPLNVLALSRRERQKRDKELQKAKLLEDGGIGDLLESPEEPDRGQRDTHPDEDAEETER